MSFLLSPMRRQASSLRVSSASTARLFSTSRPSQLARMTIVGRLGTDPEVNESANGNQVIKYVIGSSYGPKDNKQTSWFRVASFAPQDSPSRNYLMGLQKGTLVYLEGDATMRTYEDAEGKKQSALSVVQTKIEVLKRPQPSTEDAAEGGALGV